MDMLPLIAEIVSWPASAFHRLGDLERGLSQPEKARERYDRALKLYVSEQDGLGQPVAYGGVHIAPNPTYFMLADSRHFSNAGILDGLIGRREFANLIRLLD